MSMPADRSVSLSSLQPGASRVTRVALIASLALNALFIGGVASAFIRHGMAPRGWSRPGGPQMGLGAYVATLPADRAKAILGRVGDRRQIMGPIHREVRQARDAALAALSAEPFDKERFLAAQTQLIETENRQRMAQRDILAEIAGSMTPEERRAYLHWRGNQLAARQEDAHPAPKQEQ